MERSEQIDALAAALAKAQGQMGFAVKGVANPYFKSRYADLSAVIEAIRTPLSANGLAHTQLVEQDEQGGVIIRTLLMHASGQWLASRLRLQPVKQDAQAIGSAISYGRRYALQALVGVASSDDDGNAASHDAPPVAEPKAPPPAPRGINATLEDWLAALEGAASPAERDNIGKQFAKAFPKGTPEYDQFIGVYKSLRNGDGR